MRAIDIIEKKRDGAALNRAEIDWFVDAYTTDRIPDYQAAALLMAITLRGMSRRETVDLTLAMARSGDQLDLHDVAPFIVDKHSSGGVGDKTSLVVLPLVAACGVPVGKMSGRGLGSSGGTLDKMEAIGGWSSHLSLDAFKRQLADVGLVLAGQTADLAPADGKLYALRDVTGTVASVPLIAASIMSKKLATGSDAIVLDVKVGNGAFMPTVAAGRELATLMVHIGSDAGRRMTALLADMNQPLGHAIGNALEVAEAVATLRGEGPADLWDHCQVVAGHMLLLAGRASTLADAQALATAVRDDGRALAMFRAMVVAQGGDGRQIDDTARLPRAAHQSPVSAPRDGYVAAVDTAALGWTAVKLGAGRQVKGAPIDPAVGLVMPTKVGDCLAAGDTIAVVHADGPEALATASASVLAALTWSATAVERLPAFYDTIHGERVAGSAPQ